jgi:hypothetical protein
MVGKARELATGTEKKKASAPVPTDSVVELTGPIVSDGVS